MLVFLAAALAAASARADGTSTTTSTGTTSTQATTTTPASYAPLATAPLPTDCVGAGAVLVEEPGRPPIALNTPAASLGASGYPGDASIVSFAGADGRGSACRTGSVELQSLSLFGGVITASSVVATAGLGSVYGLEQNGAPLALSGDESTLVGGWARLTLDGKLGRISAPLMLTLVQPHGALPARTVIFVGFGQAPSAVAKPAAKTTAKATAKSGPTSSTTHRARRKHARQHHHTKRVPQPLKVTPRLGPIHYVFPVDGGASYVDTYGANRSDIYDGWHHGDDLFVPLGTPVVAVARGTLSLVGWNPLGGWRLWLTDKDGNSFYYAHLSGYSAWILHHRHVEAGQVIGFVGRTGDAYTTTPHLHFEVHPHQLLRLGYDGAVDPTTYLHHWRIVHLPASEIPRPARLRAPAGTPREEAAVVWHELLVARHLLPKKHAPVSAIQRRPPLYGATRGAQSPGEGAGLHVTAAERTAERVAPAPGPGLWPTAVTAAVLAVGAFALFVFGRRRRWIRSG